MSKVIVHRHVVKYLQRLPREAKDRIKDLLKHLEENPLNYPNIRKTAGEWLGYLMPVLGTGPTEFRRIEADYLATLSREESV
jgi:hypothetical protein